MDSFAMGLFFRVIRLSPVFIIPPMLHSHLFVYHRHYINTATDSVFKQRTEYMKCLMKSAINSSGNCKLFLVAVFSISAGLKNSPKLFNSLIACEIRRSDETSIVFSTNTRIPSPINTTSFCAHFDAEGLIGMRV
jgi:hypothetical protein